MPALTVRCPAKLNLTLAVGPPPEASTAAGSPSVDGRHPIVSWMVATDLCDTLTLRRLDDQNTDDTHTPQAPHVNAGPIATSSWHIAFADDAPQPQTVDWAIEDDLAFRAHDAVERHLGRALPVDVTLTKRIPAGAGLGGGSADAAGVLFALGVLLGDELNRAAQHELSRALGSDVAFALLALYGHPAALATGFGDELEPLPPAAALHAVLVLPPFTCPTAAVYAALDRLSQAPHAHAGLNDDTLATTRTLATRTADLTTAALFNHLTPAACDVQPALRGLLDTLAAAGMNPHVTGSGSAVYLPARDADHAATLAERAQQTAGAPALPVRLAKPPRSG